MNRNQLMQSWLKATLPALGHANDFSAEPASEDASFRSYHRVTIGQQSLIVMDAPPSHEDCGPFLKVQQLLSDAGVPVPMVLAQDQTNGFLLLSDLGSTLFLDVLAQDNVEFWYQKATQHIHQMQTIPAQEQLPHYDETLLRTEMQLFTDWFIGKHLNYALDDHESQLIEHVQDMLVANAVEQPQAFVHRDYHSRNLMCDQQQAAVIDFQDAVWGPITYDLVSLFKDCYISWPEEQVVTWVNDFRTAYNEKHGCHHDMGTFLRWFDFMGAQRHMKAIGIFCRLNYRDGKKQYLYDIPRTMKHLQMTCLNYPELAEFNQLLDRLQPKLQLA